MIIGLSGTALYENLSNDIDALHLIVYGFGYLNIVHSCVKIRHVQFWGFSRS